MTPDKHAAISESAQLARARSRDVVLRSLELRAVAAELAVTAMELRAQAETIRARSQTAAGEQAAAGQPAPECPPGAASR